MHEKTYQERGFRMQEPRTPKQEHDPETLAAIRRAREKWLREYLERLERRSAK